MSNLAPVLIDVACWGRAPSAQEDEAGLLPLIAQLREFGVDGSDDELRWLLVEARMDPRRALNLFFDRDCCHVPSRDDSDDGGPHEGERGLPAASQPAAASHLRGRDRRRAQRHGVEAVASRASALLPPPRQLASGSNSQRSGVQPIALEGGAVGSRSSGSRSAGASAADCSAAGPAGPQGPTSYVNPMDGIAYSVDVASMTQVSAQTGETREVRRRKPECWVVKVSSRSHHRTGWVPFPKEVSRALEEAHQHRERSRREEEEAEAEAARHADEAGSPLGDLLGQEARAAAGEMDRAQVDAALQTALREAGRDRRLAVAAARLVGRLAERQGLRCMAADARQAGLVIGSMALLREVLASEPSLQLLGSEVFDQRYAGLKFNISGRKDGVRGLLARGMTLGAHAPPSKLLRKIEADAVPLWHQRFFEAMLGAHPTLPDCAVDRIRSFLHSADAREGGAKLSAADDVSDGSS